MTEPERERDRPPDGMSLPVITIELAGDEDLDLPSWVRRLEENVIEPLGLVELTIIKLLETGEIPISSEEMRRRARARRANLGLSHGQAFHAKYRKIGFGLPVGTCIVLPGTVVIADDDADDDSECISCLRWAGGEWSISWRWRWLARIWYPHSRLLRWSRPANGGAGKSR